MLRLSKVLYFDPFSGIAGDMAVGALVDLGADWAAVEDAVRAMGVPNLAVSCRPAAKGAVQAMRFEAAWSPTTPPAHRHLGDVLDMVRSAHLGSRAESCAIRAFSALAAAEAAIHGVSPDAVHLHEVGAEDAIADIVAACVALETLDPDVVLAGPVAVGTGWTASEHGPLPVPAPATLELLRGYLIQSGAAARELATPTGAALLRGFEARPVPSLPRGAVIGVGYGAGSADLEHPNVLRVLLMDAAGAGEEAAWTSLG